MTLDSILRKIGNVTLKDMAEHKVRLSILEKSYILLVYNLNDCNKTNTAKALGINIRTLQRTLLRYECEAYDRAHPPKA